MVAMSMADGYARLTGQPQCVIVHVDVGTQGLGAAVHNASCGRAPVLVFAGLSPFTQAGELRGSRTEFIHWIQDVPDQKQIVAQYCRYAAEIKTGLNVKQMVNRALQFARSDPQGPTYLYGAREVMEMELERQPDLRADEWDPVTLGGLPRDAARRIAEALAGAKAPVFLTGYAGRNKEVPGVLVKLADKIGGLRVLDTGGSDMCFPADHPAWIGLRYGVHDAIRNADVVLVVDCDVPWIPTQCAPKEGARIFHIDIDPLKQQMPVFYIPAQERYRADALTSLEQIVAALDADELRATLDSEANATARKGREASYNQLLAAMDEKYRPLEDDTFGTGHLCRTLRKLCPLDTIWAVEAVTNTAFTHDGLMPTLPGSWINCGGGGLGWSGGGALGIKLATDRENGGKGKFVVQIVGDGTYMFSVPGSVYWIARRYNIPVLTIVLNNKGMFLSPFPISCLCPLFFSFFSFFFLVGLGWVIRALCVNNKETNSSRAGWNAPRHSYLLVHPDGEASRASNEEINISFDPVPDYAGIAKAAAGGELHAARVDKASDLERVLAEAVKVVEGGVPAVVDVKVVKGC